MSLMSVHPPESVPLRYCTSVCFVDINNGIKTDQGPSTCVFFSRTRRAEAVVLIVITFQLHYDSQKRGGGR